MLKRNRSRQTTTLQERLAAEAARLRAEARELPPGARRDTLLEKARQDETAIRIEGWLQSPGLRPPT